MCDALVHRLHRELGHSDIRGMVGQSCVKIVLIKQCWQPPKLMHCTACQESARMFISSCDQWKRSWSLEQSLQMDNFYWKHPLKEVHVKGTLLVDASSRAGCDSDLANSTSSGTSWKMCQLRKQDKCFRNRGFKFYGRPETVMTDPEGCFRETFCFENGWLRKT